MKVHFIILSAFLSLGFIPATAYASSVMVLGVSSIDGDDALASDITYALRSAARNVPGWTVGGRDVTLAQLQLAYGCSGDSALPDLECLQAVATAEGGPSYVNMIIYGTLRRSGTGDSMRMVLELQLYEVENERITHDFTVDMTVEQIMTVDERNRLAPQWLARLTGSSAESSSESRPSPRTASFDLEYVAWPLIGLAIVSLGIEIGAWAGLDGLQHNADFTAYRSSFGSGTGNACNQPSSGSMLDERGHSLCSQGDMLETLEWVFMAVGLGSAAAGITTLVLDLTGQPATDEHAFMIRPTVSSTRAGIELAWRL